MIQPDSPVIAAKAANMIYTNVRSTSSASFEAAASSATGAAPDCLPFAREEYNKRRSSVRRQMEARGIDVLYVTSPANLLYLTGYEAIWYPSRLPVGVAIDRHSDRVVLFDWTRHEGYVTTRVLYDEIVWFDYANAPQVVAEAFVTRSWNGHVAAIEWCSPNPSAAVMTAVSELLHRAGTKVVSGDWIVDGVRLYKSAAELAYIRRAAVIADSAMLQLRHDLRPGMSAVEVSAHLMGLLAERGSEHASMPPLVSAGPTAWADVHAFPSTRHLQAGDIVAVDCCAVVARYHANLARTFILGTADHPAREMLDSAGDAVLELRRKARLGDGPEIAAAAADRYVRERIAAENVWWVGGYALGLGLPPSWGGHTYLANDGVEKCSWLLGYVSNFETVLVDRKIGFAAENIDTVVMTETGLEVLSGVPRCLMDVAL
jgi:Xaa-Pro aminopeptidase